MLLPYHYLSCVVLACLPLPCVLTGKLTPHLIYRPLPSTNKLLTKPRNWLFYTGTYGVSAPLLGKIFDICNTTLYDFNSPGGVVWSIAFEPLPTTVTKYGGFKSGNSLGTSPKDGNAVSKLPKNLLCKLLSQKQYPPGPLSPSPFPSLNLTAHHTVLLLAALWPTTASNPLVSQTAQTLLSAINNRARDMNLLHEFQYLNYAEPSQDPIGSYGDENVESLRRASREYDPRGVFQRQVPGGFKLWR